MKVSREESSSWLVTGLGEAAVIALSLEGFFFSSTAASGGVSWWSGRLPGSDGDAREPSTMLASFQLPGLACFGGIFLSLSLPNDWGRGVTDFLVEATLMVASSSGRVEEGG